MGRKAKAKSWKAVTLDWTALLGYDHDEQLGICLTQRQVAICKALLTPAYWSTRWTNLTATQDELENFVSQIDFKLDGNDCEAENMKYRDNPSDPCEVQYSTDGGIIWQTMFRKDNCTPPSKQADITKVYVDIDIVTTNNTTYAGDIINVAPGWEYLDPDQDNALCWVISFYVDWICEVAIKQIQSDNLARRNTNDWMFDLADLLAAGVVAGIVELAVVIGSVTFNPVLVGAAIWGASYYLETFLDGLIGDDYESFENETAKTTIKCMMYDNITGFTPQFDLWSASLEHWEGLGGDYKAIAEQVNIINQSLDTYINYMMLMEDLNNVGDTLPACPCPDTWSHVWNFRTHGPDTWIIDKLGTPDAIGFWDAGNGFVAEDLPGGHGKNTLNYAVFPELVPRVKEIEITYDCTKGHWDSNETAVAIGGTGIGEETWSQAFISTEDGQQKEYTFVTGEADNVYVFLRSSWDESLPHDLGEMILWKVEMRGDGVDPFSGRITS